MDVKLLRFLGFDRSARQSVSDMPRLTTESRIGQGLLNGGSVVRVFAGEAALGFQAWESDLEVTGNGQEY